MFQKTPIIAIEEHYWDPVLEAYFPPGLGSLFTEAVARRDYTVLMALVMLSGTAVVAFNIIADFAHAVIDPRTATI